MKPPSSENADCANRSGPRTAAAPLRSSPPAQKREDIAHEIEDRLRGSSYLALRNIHCVCHAGAVTLQGRLPTYYLKQLVLQIVSEVAGSRATHDQIDVLTPERPSRRSG